MVLDHKTNPLLPNFNFAPAAIFQLEKKLKQNQSSVNSCPVGHLWFIYRPKYNSQSLVSLSFAGKLDFLPLFVKVCFCLAITHSNFNEDDN